MGEGGGRNRLHKNQVPHHDPTYPSPNAPVADERVGQGYGAQQHQHGMGAGAGMGAGGMGGGMGGAQGYNNNMNTGAGGMDEPGYGAGAAGASGGAAQHAMPPRHDAMGNPAQPHQSSGGKFTGKVESALGTVLGSQSLKAKGEAKEQLVPFLFINHFEFVLIVGYDFREAQALKVQSAEISEAERLEQTALARRERAVAHGAHPDHKHLGGHNPGAGAQNVNELGGGIGSGVGVGGAGGGARGGY